MHILRRLLRFALFTLAFALASAVSARNPYEGVTVVTAQRVAGGTFARADDTGYVKELMREINAERSRLWTGYRGPLSPCAVRLTFFDGERRVGRLVLDGVQLIEFLGASESTGVAREVARSDMYTVRKFAARVQGGGCAR
jgi:hypothetical protein